MNITDQLIVVDVQIFGPLVLGHEGEAVNAQGSLGTVTHGATRLLGGGVILDDIEEIVFTQDLKMESKTWGLRVKPRRDYASGQTWEDVVRPMDYIEMRMTHDEQVATNPPIVLRGFVDQVREVVQTSAGKVTRYILINGRGIEKILMLRNIYVALERDAAQLGGEANPDSGLVPSEITKLVTIEDVFNDPNAQNVTPDQFVQKVLDAFVNYDITGMEQTNAYLNKLKRLVLVPSVQGYICNLGDISTQLTTEGTSLLTFLKTYQSPPTTEIFLRDEADASYFIWRPIPFLDKDGNSIWAHMTSESGSPWPQEIVNALTPNFTGSGGVLETNEVLYSEIIGKDFGQSDDDIFTYFFTKPTEWHVDINDWRLEGNAFGNTPRNPILFNGTNGYENLVGLYGFRRQETSIGYVLPFNGQHSPATDQTEPEAQQTAVDLGTLCAAINESIAKAFSNTTDLKSGTLTLVGRADIKAGNYLYFPESDSWAYCEGVQQSITGLPKQPQWTTNVTITRGHGKVVANV